MIISADCVSPGKIHLKATVFKSKNPFQIGRSQNTVPIASTQVAIKGIVQYSMGAQFLVEQLATRHSREHMLSAVGPDAPVE